MKLNQSITITNQCNGIIQTRTFTVLASRFNQIIIRSENGDSYINDMFTSNGKLLSRQALSRSEEFKKFAKAAYMLQKELQTVAELEELI